MKTYSKHTKISANDIREINPFDYLKYYVDNIQPFTQFKDSPEIFYEGMTKEEFFVKYKEEFSNILQPIIKDERLSILQDELEEEGKEVCMFNMYLLAKFLVERGKSRYLFLLRPSISETLAALKEVSKITFTNKDNTTVETKSTMLIKKVIETLEANKEADAMNYEVERTVTWDKMSNNSIMQSYFVNDLTKFLHEYFPVKRKKDALVSTKEVELILYLMKLFGLSTVELTNKRYWQLMKIYKDIEHIPKQYGEFNINGKKSLKLLYFIPYSMWHNGKIEWTEKEPPQISAKEGQIVTFYG